MNPQLRELLAVQDPSLPLAVAALVMIADDAGVAAFGELAVAYRHDHLELLRREKGDAVQQRGVLSVDEVRHHLLTSVLPRLLTAGVVESTAPSRHPGSHSRTLSDYAVLEEGLRIVPGVWATLSHGREQVREELMSLALAALQASEAPAAPQPVEPSGSVLEGHGLTKSYRRRKVVDDVNISLRQGEIVGLLGPNGAGKTTTFYMIVGLIRPDAGRIGIDGKDISGLPMYKRARRGIGYLAQEPSIFRKLTVEDNVRAILETQALSESDRNERLESLLDELSIKYLRNVPAYKLSGGERRRLEITRSAASSCFALSGSYLKYLSSQALSYPQLDGAVHRMPPTSARPLKNSSAISWRFIASDKASRKCLLDVGPLTAHVPNIGITGEKGLPAVRSS